MLSLKHGLALASSWSVWAYIQTQSDQLQSPWPYLCRTKILLWKEKKILLFAAASVTQSHRWDLWPTQHTVCLVVEARILRSHFSRVESFWGIWGTSISSMPPSYSWRFVGSLWIPLHDNALSQPLSSFEHNIISVSACVQVSLFRGGLITVNWGQTS